MDVDIIELSNYKARFILTGATPAFANGIRRCALSEVPTLAIDEVDIYYNNSVLFDEQLALRLGLIPLKADTDLLVFPDECDCDGGCSKCQVFLTLNVEGPKTVYSEELISADPDVVEVADKKIPIVKLKEDQTIMLNAIARLGIGRDHAKWQSGVACGYKNMPIITIEECDLCGKCIEECPRDILKYNAKEDRIIASEEDVIKFSLCKLCEQICELNAIQISENPTTFIYNIESDGSMTATDLIIKAADVIKKKSEELGEILSSLE
ncbi:MAG: DNA-directed RNA polymerase subunit D [Methanosarcinales archaeon]